LDRGDWLHSVCAADGLGSWFGKTEVLYLALLDEVLHCACNFFDWHARIDPVLIEEIDSLDPQSLE